MYFQGNPWDFMSVLLGASLISRALVDKIQKLFRRRDAKIVLQQAIQKLEQGNTKGINEILSIVVSLDLTFEDVETGLKALFRFTKNYKIPEINQDCKYYSNSKYLKCAVNPSNLCIGCNHYEPK